MDLPPISEDFNDPLPQVDPNSELVPYRMSRTDPGGQPVVTTGYGQRARPPVQMPDSFGGGFPDLNSIATSAFSKLPVDEAIKAVEAATRYQGQRGYQRDLQSGMNSAQAFAKWGPMLFRQATGIPEAMEIQAKQTAAAQGAVHAGSPSGLYRIKPGQPAEQLVAPRPLAPIKPAASIQIVDEIQKADDDAAAALKAGDNPTAERLKARAQMLREQTKGQEVVTGYDDQGRPIVKVGKGVGGDATVGMATQAQEKLVKYKNSIQLMNSLENVLKPEHVGVRGAAGEVLVDKGLQQAAEALGMPDVANKDRIQSRKLMVALREGLMREMNDGSRFSMADREEISKALPSSGIFESGRDAQEALNVVRRVITQRSQNYARSIGKPVPLWTLTGPQIKAQFPNAQALVAAAKAGRVDKQEAEDALTAYY